MACVHPGVHRSVVGGAAAASSRSTRCCRCSTGPVVRC